MLTYRKMVEEIQAYLNSPDQSADEKIRDLGARYAAVCREINDRLRQCQLFIEQCELITKCYKQGSHAEIQALSV